MQTEQILHRPIDIFRGRLGDIQIYYNRRETKCVNVDEALLLSHEYDYVSYTEWREARLTLRCARWVSEMASRSKLPPSLMKIVLAYIIAPEEHSVLGDPYPFWKSDSLGTVSSNFLVLDATLRVPLHVVQKYGLQVYGQRANIFSVDDDDVISLYRSQSVSDATWGRGQYFKASETVVVFY